jgi:3-hydroxyacyl-CoA dehydrogenase/enoyl-CoA hydratase/3-hydroxybutyryl-CoA epimerase
MPKIEPTLASITAKYGERFTPPALLKTKAEQKQNIQ